MPILIAALFIISLTLMWAAAIGMALTILFKVLSWVIAGLIWVLDRAFPDEPLIEPNIVINIDEDEYCFPPMRDVTPRQKMLR